MNWSGLDRSPLPPARAPARRAWPWLPPAWCCLCLVLVAGCMERSMEITSDPPGATVIVNESEVGTTPYTYRFKHYGTFGIRLEKKGYQPMYVREPIAPPAHQRPGPDFFVEVSPAQVSDRRRLHYRLRPIGAPEDQETVLARAEEARGKLGYASQLTAAEEARRREEGHFEPPFLEPKPAAPPSPDRPDAGEDAAPPEDAAPVVPEGAPVPPLEPVAPPPAPPAPPPDRYESWGERRY